MDDEEFLSFLYAYEGGIMLVLMHAALSARTAPDDGLNGLDESEIERATDPVVFTDAAECSICIAPHERRGSVKLGCGHCFHAPCIARWLGRARTCPVCRGPVRPVRPVMPEVSDDGHRSRFIGPVRSVRPDGRSRTVRRYAPYEDGGPDELDELDGPADMLGPLDLTP